MVSILSEFLADVGDHVPHILIGQVGIAAERRHGHERTGALKAVFYVLEQLLIRFGQDAPLFGEVRHPGDGPFAVATVTGHTSRAVDAFALQGIA